MVIGLVAPRTPATDRRRAVELLHYLSHDDITPGGVPTSDNDAPTISAQLRPYCQLIANRTKASRVMLNVMDQDVMYFLSEAVHNEDEPDDLEDPIMQACSGAVPLSGRVCEMVIGMTATKDTAPTFVVPDLTQSRFSKLDVVTGPPHFRFYAGTPITTRHGITIGSLAFLDTKARMGLTRPQEKCLTHVAALVMERLEAHRQAIEGRRSMRLARALELFLAGKSVSPLKSSVDLYHRSKTYAFPQISPPDELSRKSSSHMFVRRMSLAPAEGTDEETASDDTGSVSPFVAEEALSASDIYRRAASHMCQGFACVDEDDMVLFVTIKTRSLDAVPGAQVKVLAGATPSGTLSDDVESKFTMENDVLAGFVRHYQGGCIFVLDELQAPSDEDAEDIAERDRKRTRKARELQALKDAFPQAKQVLFCPIWDSTLDSYNKAVFVSSSAQYVPLSPMIELSFLNSFCNSVATECTRIDVIKAEKQKSDFVGTISHEMRSPLHGILASAEFLADTQLSSYQQTLVDTVRSCGRTLLDTIDHVLDFAKISTFRKEWQNNTKRARGLNGRKPSASQSAAPSAALPALLQLTSVVNIGVVVEEVVDSLVLAQDFVADFDFTDMSRRSRGRGKDASKPSTAIDVLIEVQPADWNFVVQPGAIRRIVLNLVGNALKYTAEGQVIVRLDLTGANSRTMTLTVIDTGQGIGRRFLNSLLYVPFAQENILAPGTGLGLSIVNNIVTMLGGTIDIQSDVGKGTTVKVLLPLERPLPGQTSTTTTPQTGSTVSASSADDDPITWLKTQSNGRKAAVYEPLRRERTILLTRYLSEWYGFSLTDNVDQAQLIVTEERDLERLRGTLSALVPDRISAIIVLCSAAEKHEASYTKDLQLSLGSTIEWLPKPIGPHKLAQAIRNVLQRDIVPGRAVLGPPGLAPVSEWASPINPKLTPPQTKHHGTHQLADGFSEMTISQRENPDPTQVVQATEQIAVSQISQHAQQAIQPPEQNHEKELSNVGEAFPFPDQGAQSKTDSTVNIGYSLQQKDSEQPPGHSRVVVTPSVLVVDDNAVNSALLRTFLTKKRKYSQVDCAINGQEAVERFTNSPSRYDIVFMDISMPIMDGFEATRTIRRYEKDSADRKANGTMVVALTGLSSARDQAEGFEAGMDIYLTKPVAFKAVGQLLDNWEVHRRAECLHAEM